MKPASNKKTKPEGRGLLNELFFKYLPYWPLFVATGMICVFAAWFYLRTAVPKFQASASLMLKDETKGAEDGATLHSLDRLSDKKIIENELQVLQSRTLMLDVVKRLHLYASYFEEGELIPKPAYVTTPVIIEAADPETMRSHEKIMFSFSRKDSSVVIGKDRYPLNQFVSTPYGYLRFVRNPNFKTPAQKPLYFNLTNVRSATGYFLSGLAAVAGRESTVVSLAIKDIVPERAEDVLDELMLAYDRSNMDEKNKLANNTIAFVEERLANVQRELNEINEKKQAYKTNRGAVNIGSQGELYLKSVGQIDDKVADVNNQLTVLSQVEKYVRSKDQSSGIVPTTLGTSDPMLSKLVNELYDAEIQYEKLKKTAGEGNPIAGAMKDKIDKLRPSILENLEEQKKGLQATKLNLAATTNMYSSMLQSIPEKERDLIDIDREQGIKLGIYNFLRQKREESALAVADLSGSRIVDRAQSSYAPVSPNSKMIYIVAMVIGLGLPVLFIFIRELLNRKIMFRSEIEKLTSAPILGEVIFDKTKNPIVIEDGKRTFIAEQFRRIRTSLSYLGLNNTQKKKILITSSLSGEGKSFVATNLALSLALTGKKVVLLEFDLANPTLSHKLNLHYEQGASNYLTGECEPEEVIKRTTINENLFFIPCGPLPDNPSELLMSDRVKELFDYLDAIFDHIVIDSAPASLLSDAYVLSPLCDATLYVVKHKFTPKIFLERLDEENTVNQLKNLGIIFNGIHSRGFTKNGYGYGYGYGYIHDTTSSKKRKKVYAK